MRLTIRKLKRITGMLRKYVIPDGRIAVKYEHRRPKIFAASRFSDPGLRISRGLTQAQLGESCGHAPHLHRLRRTR